jgi:hypothetical protein
MGFPDVAWLAWPWVGLGGAVVLFIVLFATDWLRGDSSRGRWHDAAWLAWLPVPVYLLHVFEEYGLHVTGGQFDLVTSFVETGVDAMFGGIPLALFPEVNVLLIYVAFPIAAFLGGRRPIVGFMPYGFMLVNGLTHIGGTLRAGGGFLATPGNFTGLLVFIPLFVWFCYACRKDRLLSAKGMALAIVAGVVQHLGVFSVYAVNMLLGHTAAIVWTPFMCCLGIALGLLFGRRREGAR